VYVFQKDHQEVQKFLMKEKVMKLVYNLSSTKIKLKDVGKNAE